MEEQELLKIWKSFDEKLEEARVLNLQSWVLNLQSFEAMQTAKAKVKMDALAGFKTRAVVLGVLYVLLLAVLAWGNHFRNIYFTLSVLLILLINLFVTAVYIHHIIMIRQLDYADNLTETQEKLSRLQASTIQLGRIAWLQLPFYSTWFWNNQWIQDNPVSFWGIACPIASAFAIMSFWLYRNISERNMNRKWFRILFNSPEWKSVRKSIEFLQEIEDFKAESLSVDR
jgi:hypothetical protein